VLNSKTTIKEQLFITHFRGKSDMLNQFFSEGLRGKSLTTMKTYHHAIQQFEIWLEGAGTNLIDYARSDVQ
jgi:integrase/recombinase XerC/integrase/recombinase XerD